MTNPPHLFSRETREWFKGLLLQARHGCRYFRGRDGTDGYRLLHSASEARTMGPSDLVRSVGLFVVFMSCDSSLQTRAAEFFWRLFKRRDTTRS